MRNRTGNKSGILQGLFFCNPEGRGWWYALDILAVVVGLAAGLGSLYYMAGPLALLFLSMFFCACLILVSTSFSGFFMRLVSLVAGAFYLFIFLFFIYQALSFGLMLWWAVPLWAHISLILLSAAAISASISPFFPFRINIILPVGLWIAACLLGWQKEEGVARCRDYRSVVGQPGASVPYLSESGLVKCDGNERFHLPGYPRKMLDHNGYLFIAVQVNKDHGNEGKGAFTGGLCRIDYSSGNEAPPVECSQDRSVYYGIAAGSSKDLYMAGHSGLRRLSAEPPFEILSEMPEQRGVAINAAHWPDTKPDYVYVFYDPMDRIEVLNALELDLVRVASVPVGPEEIRRYPGDVGLYCFASTPLRTIGGRAYLALAFDDDPLDVRLLGSNAPWAVLAWSESCDYDPESGIVFAGIGTLGIIAAIDYQTGGLVKVHLSRFGIRPMLLDRQKGMLYSAGFFDGWVHEMNIGSGKIERKWFAGRFVRHISLAPSGNGILVSSNLGIVHIET